MTAALPVVETSVGTPCTDGIGIILLIKGRLDRLDRAERPLGDLDLPCILRFILTGLLLVLLEFRSPWQCLAVGRVSVHALRVCHPLTTSIWYWRGLAVWFEGGGGRFTSCSPRIRFFLHAL